MYNLAELLLGACTGMCLFIKKSWLDFFHHPENLPEAPKFKSRGTKVPMWDRASRGARHVIPGRGKGWKVRPSTASQHPISPSFRVYVRRARENRWCYWPYRVSRFKVRIKFFTYSSNEGVVLFPLQGQRQGNHQSRPGVLAKTGDWQTLSSWMST